MSKTTSEATKTTERSRHGKRFGEESEILTPPPAPPTDGCAVMVKRGVTLNMGDFNSVRIDISLTMPCKANLESVERAYGIAQQWVDTKVNEEIKAATDE